MDTAFARLRGCAPLLSAPVPLLNIAADICASSMCTRDQRSAADRPPH